MCADGVVEDSAVDTDANSSQQSQEELNILTQKEAALKLQNIPQLTLEEDLDTMDISSQASFPFPVKEGTKRRKPYSIQTKKKKPYLAPPSDYFSSSDEDTIPRNSTFDSRESSLEKAQKSLEHIHQGFSDSKQTEEVQSEFSANLQEEQNVQAHGNTDLLLGNESIKYLIEEFFNIVNATEKKIMDRVDAVEKKVMDEVQKRITLMERRIHYDFKQQKEETMNVLKTLSTTQNVEEFLQNPSMSELPIKTLEEFKMFNINLDVKDDLQKNLKAHILREIVNCLNVHDAVKSLMPTLIKKEVQVHYSGTGKKSKGTGKLSFKDTPTFSCISGIVKHHIKDAKETDISSAIGIWLSQSGDREGGRKKRCEEKKDENASTLSKSTDETQDDTENI
ncbi:uncharacterized protein LOC122512901 [Leptopilina heterotoma]|uniref:uncharacterized protein LOC122512901 n=1 Tax=Leptopilina heterotoma TaxID=63436 RepID=UPI001CA91ADD|nr:uncharacterized protein LOC122512901 [Leptopilina heterotoma]